MREVEELAHVFDVMSLIMFAPGPTTTGLVGAALNARSAWLPYTRHASKKLRRLFEERLLSENTNVFPLRQAS